MNVMILGTDQTNIKTPNINEMTDKRRKSIYSLISQVAKVKVV